MAPSILQMSLAVSREEQVARKRKLQAIGEDDVSCFQRHSTCHLDSSQDVFRDNIDHASFSTPGIDESAKVPSHPLGLKPLGNALGAAVNIRDNSGLFSFLPEELIVQLVENLNPRDLLALGATCKALYAFCHLDEMWKALVLEYVSEDFPASLC